MRFYKKNNKQHVDMQDDLLITRQDPPVSHSCKSALPFSITGGESIHVPRKGFRAKVRASINALNFIWS